MEAVVYQTHLEIVDGSWMAECAMYPCEGHILSPSGSTAWLRDDYMAVSGTEGVSRPCGDCGDESSVIVPSNRYPCSICGNSVKPAEGYCCDSCGIPLCGGNACGGAHESDCKAR